MNKIWKKKPTKNMNTKDEPQPKTYGGYVGDDLTAVTAQPITGLQKTTYTYT